MDVEQEISKHREFLNHLPESSSLPLPHRQLFCAASNNLGNLLIARFRKLDKVEDLDAAVLHYSKAVRLCPTGFEQLGSFLTTLGDSFLQRFERLGKLADLSEAISTLRKAAAHSPDGRADKSMILCNLGKSLYHRFQRLYSLEDVNEGISALQKADKLTLNNHPYKSTILSQLGISLLNRFQCSDDLADINAAVTVLQRCAALVPENHVDKPAALNNLGRAFLCRFERFKHPTDANEAMSTLKQAAALTSNGDADMSVLLEQLQGLGASQSEQSGDKLADTDADAFALVQTAALTPDSHPEKPKHLFKVGCSLLARFSRTKGPADIDEAVTTLQRVVALTPDGHMDKYRYLSKLGASFLGRYELLRNLKDIDSAISILQQAAALTPDGAEETLEILMHLGGSFILRFERLGNLADIDESIPVMRKIAARTPDSDAGKPDTLFNVARSFLRRFDRLGHTEDADEAISVLEKAVALTPDDHENNPKYLNNLGSLYYGRFNRSGNLKDIEKAISILQQAATTSSDTYKPEIFTNLGNSLLERYKRLGDLTDMEQSIAAHRKAVALTPADHKEKTTQLGNLASSLLDRFERFGKLTDVDEGIYILQQAIALTPEDHTVTPNMLDFIAKAHNCRFERLGNLEDANETVSACRKAVSLTPDDHAQKPFRLLNLGTVLIVRSGKSNSLTDINESVSTLQQALEILPKDHPHMAGALENLGLSLFARFKQTVSFKDIDSSISILREAVAKLPDDHSRRPACLDHLGLALRHRFLWFARLDDINEAIAAQEKAVLLTPESHARRSDRLDSIGLSFRSRFELSGNLDDIDNAIDAYRESAQSPFGHPSTSLESAREWAGVSLRRHGQPSLDAHKTVISLIPRVIWVGSNISRRLDDILTIGDAVNEAAAAAIELEKYDLAIEWLEQGRSVVWGQILHLRSPLDVLKTSDKAELADKLEEVSRQLESAGTTQRSLLSVDSEQQKISLEQEAQAHRRSAERYEELLAEVRQVPGFEGFLQPKRVSDLVGATTSGAVVVINTHKTRCDALILRNATAPILHVSLPSMTHKIASGLHTSMVTFLVNAGVRVRDSRGCRPNTLRTIPTMRKVLETLWTGVVEPVLSKLGYMSQPTSGTLPHITWCATGPFAFLPLHAVGLYGAPDQPKIFQHVVSSYTPSLTALVESFKRPSNPRPGILAISQPQTPGLSRLPGTISEIETVKNCIDSRRFKWLNDKEATIGAVLNEMEQYGWCHLACHGIQHREDPTKSAFALQDGMLDLAAIMSKSFGSAEMAFLSACQTATGDEKRPEEAVHLAAGMLMAGYRTVFATMWSIGDRDAPVIAKEVYTRLMESGGAEKQRWPAAYALHAAVDALREKVGEQEFVKWVPFIHVGV